MASTNLSTNPASQTYASVTKFGKAQEDKNTPTIPPPYKFTSRFVDILNRDNSIAYNSFFNGEEPSCAWSKRYFEALEMPDRSKNEKLAKYLVLHSIHNDFVAAASTYAKTIISEHYLTGWRTLQPEKSIRGHGGEKYVVHGILFKFASGEGLGNVIFEGSDENASKAIGQEIKGVNSYTRTSSKLCYALQCLVDYKGFRLHCQAKLDIDGTTLRVGSADAGESVKGDDNELLERMKNAAQELNIREHVVKGQKLYSAGDCEGHQGKDGRYYVVDLARVFPPEFPGYMYKLGLRIPELALRQAVFVNHNDEFKFGRIVNIYPDSINSSSSSSSSCLGQSRHFDIVLEPSKVVLSRVDSNDVQRAPQCIFWKFLRPEFVRSRGRSLLKRYPFSVEGIDHLLWLISDFTQQFAELDRCCVKEVQESCCNDDTCHGCVNSDGCCVDSCSGTSASGIKPNVETNSEDLYTPIKSGNEYYVTYPLNDDLGAESSGAAVDCIPCDSQNASQSLFVSRVGEQGQSYPGVQGLKPPDSKAATNTAFSPWISSLRKLIALNPQPLSSDAFSGFAKGDTERNYRDSEVKFATKELLFVLIPNMAKDLIQIGHPQDRALITIADYMHYYGVNFRHGGYLRFVFIQQLSSTVADDLKCESPDIYDELTVFTLARQRSTDSSCSQDANKQLRAPKPSQLFRIQSDLLRECLTRTLKCMLREIQRDWIRSQKTASEQGIKFVIVKFLNLVSGSLSSSKEFWEHTVPDEIIKRFGELTFLPIPESLAKLLTVEMDEGRLNVWQGKAVESSEAEASGFKCLCLWDVIRYDSEFLFAVITELCKMAGIRLTTDCESQLKNYQPVPQQQLPVQDTFVYPSPRHPQSPFPPATPTHHHNHNIHRRSESRGETSAFDEGYRSLPPLSSARSTPRIASSSAKKPAGDRFFLFVVSDIDDIVPVVKHLHQLDLVTGIMLKLQAEESIQQIEPKIRLLRTAIATLFRARRAVPDDVSSRHELTDAHQLLFLSLNQQIRMYEQEASAAKSEAQQREICELINRNKKEAAQAKNIYERLHEMDKHTICQSTKSSYREDIIGIVVTFTYKYPNRRNALPMIKDVIVDPICHSLSWFRDEIERFRSPSSSFGQRIKTGNKRFLPIIINKEHADKCIPLLLAELMRARNGHHESCLFPDQEAVVEPSDLRIRYGPTGPEYNFQDAFLVVAAVMNAVIVKICTAAAENTEKMLNAGEVIIEYLRLYHMLLYLADNDKKNNWRDVANKRVKDFIFHPDKRDKTLTPNLGWFLIYLLLSKYTWKDVAEAFFHESLRRQVYHYLTLKRSASGPSSRQRDTSSSIFDDEDDLHSVQSFPQTPRAFSMDVEQEGEGLDTTASVVSEDRGNQQQAENYSPELAYLGELDEEELMHYRLFRTFDVTKTGGRIILFQIYFLQMSNGHSGIDRFDEDSKLAAQQADLAIYNMSQGFPVSKVRNDLLEEFESILSVKDYEGLLQRMELYYTPQQMNIFLRRVVRSEIEKGSITSYTLSNLEAPTVPEDPKDHALPNDVNLVQNWHQLWVHAREKHERFQMDGVYDAKLCEWRAKVEASKSPEKQQAKNRAMNNPNASVRGSKRMIRRQMQDNQLADAVGGFSDRSHNQGNGSRHWNRGSGAMTYSSAVMSGGDQRNSQQSNRFRVPDSDGGDSSSPRSDRPLSDRPTYNRHGNSGNSMSRSTAAGAGSKSSTPIPNPVPPAFGLSPVSSPRKFKRKNSAKPQSGKSDLAISTNGGANTSAVAKVGNRKSNATNPGVLNPGELSDGGSIASSSQSSHMSARHQSFNGMILSQPRPRSDTLESGNSMSTDNMSKAASNPWKRGLAVPELTVGKPRSGSIGSDLSSSPRDNQPKQQQLRATAVEFTPSSHLLYVPQHQHARDHVSLSSNAASTLQSANVNDGSLFRPSISDSTDNFQN